MRKLVYRHGIWPSVALFLVLALSLLSGACGSSDKDLILATTTSTVDSGLLDVLIPAFEKEAGYNVKPIGVGSGQAMEMGRRGDADVLLVHSPAAEEQFMKDGQGVNRQLVMHNDFVIVGPDVDPAGIKGKSASDAMKAIAASGQLFLSRGDDSGTNAKELGLWKKASLSPEGQSWYQKTGQGMGDTLTVTDQKNGYTLSDRATYLALSKNLRLVILNEGDPSLLNIYHVIQVNPDNHSGLNVDGAAAFAKFLISKQAQQLIADFGRDKFGQPLFFPDAGKAEEKVGR